MLRPMPARWFEALVAQDDAAAALETLAGTGTVELEIHTPQKALVPLAEIKPALDTYTDLASRYRAYWPARAGSAPREPRAARKVLDDGLKRLGEWCEAAKPVIRRLQTLEQEAAELEIWRELFTRFKGSEIEFSLLHQPDALLAHRLYVFPPDVVFPLPEAVLAQRFLLMDKSCVLVIGSPDAIANLDQQITALKGRRMGLGMPPWLEGRAANNLPRVAQRRAEVDTEIERTRAELEGLNRRHELAPAIAAIEQLRWFASQVHVLPSTDYFAWLTGWTSDLGGWQLATALEHVSLRALLHFPPPPEGIEPPLILRNPWWVRPFELFARAIGVPARNEVDPSMLLAFVVPLLFGYMFADVGQGLVILIAGIWLRGRFAVARLLIAGGAAAMAFGLLFGSSFVREDLISALWLHPMDAPLMLLIIPLVGGALLLALGLALNAVEMYWRGEVQQWLLSEAGMLTFYLALLGATVQRPLLWVALGGIVWYVAGHVLRSRSWAAVFGGFGSAVEHAFQLVVNTLSFARVGAFALAHAGLGATIVALADAAGGAAAILIMVVGNIVVIMLEGLVVSIQTTRLMLFEFFIRFLHGEGRPFRPLVVPPYLSNLWR